MTNEGNKLIDHVNSMNDNLEKLRESLMKIVIKLALFG